MSEYGSRKITLTADGVVNANRAVKITGDLVGAECSADTDVAVGISEDTVEDGQTFVCLLASPPVEAECSGAVTAGGWGAPDTDGRLKDAAIGDKAFCLFLSAASAAGERADLMLVTPFTVA